MATTSFRRRRRGTAGRSLGAKHVALIAGCLAFGSSIGRVSGLRCFACLDCSIGGAISATMEQCEPTETFCAAVFRVREDTTMGSFSSSLDRGCASSINAQCASDETAQIADYEAENGAGHLHGDEKSMASSGSPTSTSESSDCCSTDLCNASSKDTMRIDRYHRRAEAYRRYLMEGTRMDGKFSGKEAAMMDSSRAKAGEGEAEGVGNNSAPCARRAGGSRLATVLVIVGTFAQFLCLAGSLL